MSFLAFTRPSRAGEAWFNAGPTSSYPDIKDDLRLAERRPCSGERMPGCRVFHVPPPPRGDSSSLLARPVPIDDWHDNPDLGGDAGDQVMIFRYRGTFVAVNHVCPHSSYPLSNGVAFDIEDFGVTLSSGVTCPKHGWSFDMHTGKSDRGTYRLKVWEVEVRPAAAGDGVLEEAVWVRRKRRIG